MHRHLIEAFELELHGEVKTPLKVKHEDGSVSSYKTIGEVPLRAAIAPQPAAGGRVRLRRERS